MDNSKRPAKKAPASPKHKPNKSTKKLGKPSVPNYSFNPNSAVSHSISPHHRVFRCKIDGIPRPQNRTIATTRGKSHKVHHIDTSKHNKESFKDSFQKALEKAPPELFPRGSNNPFHITVRFFFPRPQKHYNYNWQTRQLTLKKDAPVYVTKVPDIDNCVKLFLDAIQGVCYENDYVVSHIDAAKLYDHTQLTWNSSQKKTGSTIIKVLQINEAVVLPGCSCLSCKHRR